MKRPRLFWLGLLGLFGLLGLGTGNAGMYGFFGFFGFFGFGSILHDERFHASVAAAGRNAFFAGVGVFAVAAVAGTLVSGLAPLLFSYALAAMFAVQMLVFTVSLVHYDRTGAIA